jgi:hypothetical protein
MFNELRDMSEKPNKMPRVHITAMHAVKNVSIIFIKQNSGKSKNDTAGRNEYDKRENSAYFKLAITGGQTVTWTRRLASKSQIGVIQ